MSIRTDRETITAQHPDLPADLAARVARGAALLDRIQPYWWASIDLPGLDIGSCYSCVLGQLFAERASAPGDTGYWWAFDAAAAAKWRTDPNPVRYGFASDPMLGGTHLEAQWDELGAAWSVLVKDRANAGGAR